MPKRKKIFPAGGSGVDDNDQSLEMAMNDFDLKISLSTGWRTMSPDDASTTNTPGV